MLATEAYTLYSAEVGSNLGMATTISIVLILLSMVFVFGQRYMSRRNIYHGNLINKPAKRRLTGFRNVVAHVVVYAIALIGACRPSSRPSIRCGGRAGRSFSPGFGLQSYQRILYNLPRRRCRTH